MKIKLADLPATLYTPDGQVWTWDAEESPELYYVDKYGYSRYRATKLLDIYGEVSTEPYPRHAFKVGDRITTEQEAQTLPMRTVVLDRDDDAFQKVLTGNWYMAGVQDSYLHSELGFPATVLWLPEDKEAQA